MSKAPEPRRALGKGLTALLPTRTPVVVTEPPKTQSHGDEPLLLPISLIDPNPLQPRRIFQTERLDELAQSIRTNGIIQPLVVRPVADRYQLVAGERRWRAARQAGIDKVPVVVQHIPDDRLLEISLIENIQREDLNPIETATAFQRLARDADLSFEEIGRRTGKDRTTITNFVRLLDLPQDVQQLIAERRLSAGHARCLLALPTPEMQREVADRAVSQGWSVRQVERLTQRMKESREPKRLEEVQSDPNVRAAIREMERVLGTKVRIIEKAKQSGRIEIDFFSSDDLDRIYTTIVGDSTGS